MSQQQEQSGFVHSTEPVLTAESLASKPTLRLFVVCVAFMLAGCERSIASDSDGGFPAGTKRITAPGNYITWVVPLTMDDGTRCIVTVKNGSGGSDLSCALK
jgi:hypothetical protein